MSTLSYNIFWGHETTWTDLQVTFFQKNRKNLQICPGPTGVTKAYLGKRISDSDSAHPN
jgi:hypothetical protein